MAIAHASGFFLTALLALGAGLSPAAEFVAEFKSMQDLDAAFTKSSWAGENRTHSAANVDVKDGILELKLSGSQPGSLPVCAEKRLPVWNLPGVHQNDQ